MIIQKIIQAAKIQKRTAFFRLYFSKKIVFSCSLFAKCNILRNSDLEETKDSKK